MLSEEEYQDAIWKFNNTPSTITGKPRQHLRAIFREKIHEHELASRYPPFEPLNYKPFYINYKTTEQILIHLIEAINDSDLFTLDTESICIPKKPNEPALIQLQIVQKKLFSYVIFVEVRHLPNMHEQTFILIQELFVSLFSSNKNIYIWGSVDELQKFLNFNLFSSSQIYLSNNINLQDEFKNFWNQHHPHKPTLSSTKDKRRSRSPFDIGLDPTLVHLNSKELAYRKTMTTYAANDCLSMHQLIISMKINKQQESSNDLSIEPDDNISIYSDSSDPNDLIISRNEHLKINHLSNVIQQNNLNVEEKSSNDDEPEQSYQQTNINKPSNNELQHERANISNEQKRKIHNRTCTLKQRKKLYKYEIIRRGIDRRFTITLVKEILRERSINFGALNISTSSLTNRTSLYIGIKNPTLLSKYERETRNLFSTDHYNEIHSQQRRLNSNFHYPHRFQHHK
ncbi:unnamed protein product [Rotaria sordida]|uniref:Uncharacterized protein n=3 Tax=Rotaria sordida TaxID=392033 RepID=A0A819TEP4_9BILA|nr:unnamed protein product [Rotaria sordida]CAF4076647.1 unnamed protein product [Rotaria sordida]